MNKLLVICGPTATGKTGLAVKLAKKFKGELISADSRQVYQGMDIGTGKDLPANSKLKTQNSKLICVLGACGGGRDKWKRPVLGEIAAKNCDEIIITNEDPYDENPMEIIEQVAQGAKGKGQKILDRREAIKNSLELAKPNDVVIITGKGCESWICVGGGKKTPWDDRQVVREEFNKLKL